MDDFIAQQKALMALADRSRPLACSWAADSG